MSAGPVMVAVQLSRLPSASGKAEMPGVVESMSCISSVWSLEREKSVRCGDDGAALIWGTSGEGKA